MGSGQFFVGLAAGAAMLAVPVYIVVLGPRLDLPAPPPTPGSLFVTDRPGTSRPLSGYRPGDPTPTVLPLPALEPASTPVPTRAPVPTPTMLPPPGPRSGVIRTGGAGTYVRRAAGIESPSDPFLAEGQPVVIGASGVLHAAGQDWLSVRGLNGVAGWVPVGAVAVDSAALPSAPPPAVAASPSPNTTGVVANTDGMGVTLRRTPNDNDRTSTALREGTAVTIVERSGSDWLHVRAASGAEGWVPAKYVRAAA